MDPFSAKLEFYKSVYFNETEYLQNKTDALNAEGANGHSNWTVALTKQTIEGAGMTVWEHFHIHGAFETNADGGVGINPSDYFNLDTYYGEKAAQMGGTKQAMAQIFKDAQLDPITHYVNHGYLEGVIPRQEDLGPRQYTDSPPISSNSIIASLHGIDKQLPPEQEKSDIDWNDWNAYAATSGDGNTLYYTFAQSMPDLSGYSNFTVMNANQKAGVVTALDYINQVTGISFQYTASTDQANIILFSADGLGLASAAPRNDINKVYIAMDVNFTDWRVGATDNSGFSAGYAYHLLLHELGHAVSLRDTYYGEGMLPEDINYKVYTIMADSWDGGDWFWETDAKYYFSPLDILALNYIYGGDGLNGDKGLVYTGSSAYSTASFEEYAVATLLDSESYMQAKLEQMQAAEADYTADQLAQAFSDAGFYDPASHYLAHGQYEGITLTGVQQDDGVVLMAEYVAA